MPLTTEATEDCLGIIHVGTGTVTGDDLVAASKAALQLVQNTQNFQYEFLDLSDVTRLQITEEHLEKITVQDRLAATFRPNAVVVMAAPPGNLFEMGRRWERKVQDLGWSTHIAHTRAEALQWLKENFPKPAAASEEKVHSGDSAD